METILVIGDPHFKLSNRLQMEVVVDECVRVAKERRPTFIVCLGDVLDRFSVIREEPLNQALDFFHRLLDVAPLFVLIGNHDRPNNATFCTAEHPFNALKFWNKPITVVDVPLLWTSPGGRGFTFVPYVPNGRFLEALDRVPGWEDSTVIFAHQDFKGAVYNGLASTTGDEWDDPDVPMVVSGHIHDFQQLENVIYPGSPIQHAADERPDKSLYWIGFADDDTVHAERILIHVPVIRTVTVKIADLEQFALPTLLPRSTVKVLVEGSYQELQGLGKRPLIKAWRANGLIVQPRVLTAKSERRAAGPTQSFRDLMSREVAGTALEPLWSALLTSVTM